MGLPEAILKDMPHRNNRTRWLRRATTQTYMISLKDSSRRDGNRRNRSRVSGHTAPIVKDYLHVLINNRGWSLRCVGAFKVIYHPLYGMNNYDLIWGDWLSCDPPRGSHDSQSPHIRKHL